MAESATVRETSSEPAQMAQGAKGQVVVNVRFMPSGLVNMINHKPERMGDQDWFDRLCRVASAYYMPLSGGRGAFSIPGGQFQLIWEANT